MPDRSVTIVHLSDLQFGKFHRFPQDPDVSNPFDSLGQRLIADFAYLRREHHIKPDILLVTGDLAEWGRKSELQQVFTFLGTAAEALDLPRSRVAVIPGNHDVDWKACEAYFLDCESREIAAVRPYPAKWAHFKAFFDEFYKDVSNVSFTDAEPWTLFEYPDLFTVIAGLNSTWMDSHLPRDHYGFLGEEQLRWFEPHLRLRKEQGWLRIAALHHNVRSGPTPIEESLHDARMLKSVLGNVVNAIVHGHTHDGQTDIFRPKVPIYSTGSAAVAVSERPPEVPNQYQVLRFGADGVHRWARAYRPDEKKFIGDTRATENGESWQAFDAFEWDDLTAFSGVTEAAESAAMRDRWDVMPPVDDLLMRIEQVCHVQHPTGAKTRQHRSPADPLPYLHLTIQDGAITTQYPIAAAEGALTKDVVAEFGSVVHARYRRYDPTVPSLIVYGGAETPDEQLQREAGRLGITLQSWMEFQGLLDFGPYVESERRRLERDLRYQPDLYVPQRIRYTTSAGDFEHENALEYMVDVMSEPEGRFVLILGEFGTGKSFLQRQLALRLSAMPRPQPILIELRTLEKANDFDQLIAQHLVRHFPSLNLRAFRYMLEHGRLALLFDGFDELAMRVSYEKATEHLKTLMQASSGQAKIVVTSRTEYFESDQQVRSALAERLETIGGRRIVRLLRFDRPRILEFLQRQLGDPEAAQQRMTLLDDIKDLSGLSENARMLSFISTLDEEQLRKARTREGKVTRSSVYRTLVVDKWLTFETDRLAPRGAAPPLSVQERWDAVMVLARHMWAKPDAAVKLTELSERIADTVGRLPRIDASAATHQVGSGTLLVRDTEGNFSFVHRSILEWLVATDAAAEIREGRTPNALMVKDISPLIADFIEEEVEPEVLLAWVRSAMTGETTDSVLRRNALLLFGRQSETAQEEVAQAETLELSDADLRGRDFSFGVMAGARLVGANLSEARLVSANFSRADLRRANLRFADLTEADLEGADLRGADLSHARLRGAKLRGALLEGANFYRADLVGVDVYVSELLKTNLLGAAAEATDARPVFDDGVFGKPTFNEAGDLLAVMEPHSIRLFDVAAGRELSPYLGSTTSRFTCMAWDLDGTRLAAGSVEGDVFLWDVRDGMPKWRTKAAESGVLAVAVAGNVIVCLTRTALIRLDKETGTCTGIVTLTSSVIAGDIDSRTGAVVVVMTGGEVGDVVADQVLTWRETARGADESRVAVSAAGHVVVYEATGQVYVLTRKRSRMAGKFADVIDIGISRDGTRAAIASAGRFSVLSTADLAVNDIGMSRRLPSFHPSNERLACIDLRRSINVMETAAFSEVEQFPGPASRIFAVGMPSEIRVRIMKSGSTVDFDLADGRLVEETSYDAMDIIYPWGNAAHYVNGDTRTVLSYTLTQSRTLRFSPRAPMLCAALASDGTVAFARPEQVVLVAPTGGRKTIEVPRVRLLQFSPDGATLVGCDEGNLLFVAAASTGRILARQNIWSRVDRIGVGQNGEITCILASGVTILRLADLSAVTKLPFHDASAVAYAPNSSLLAIGRHGGLTIRHEAGSLRHAVTAHHYQHVAFSPSERSVACATYGGLVDVFDVASMKVVASVGVLENGWTIFTPDGRFKSSGEVEEHFGHTLGLVRYAPGDLDPWLDRPLRVPDNLPLIEL